MYIVIPMAGESSRFFNAGYTVPKYMLPLGDETVFDKSVKSFQKYFNNAFFIFVVRNDKYDSFQFVDDHAKLLGIKMYDIQILKDPTKGQAETVYKSLLSHNIEQSHDELVIFNIDTIRYNLEIPIGNFSSYFDAFCDENPDEKKWSFCKLLDNWAPCLAATAEKKKISNWCSTGLYIFGSVRTYIWAYTEACKSDDYNYYIAPLYNLLIPKDSSNWPTKSSNYLLKCPATDIEFSGVPAEYEALKIKYNID